jgi:uncharacterized protein
MMRTDAGDILLSPTDLVQFLDCEHATWMAWQHIDIPKSQQNRAEADPLLVARGLQHEKDYLQRLQAEGKSVAVINSPNSFAESVEAMRRGTDVVYQAELTTGRWLGRPDFLIKVAGPSRWGGWHYEPYDTKFARSARPEHLVQLGVYAALLEAIQGTLPHRIHVVLDQFRVESFRTRDFLSYIRLAQRRLERYLAAPPPHSDPELCLACPQCDWRDHCNQTWIDADDLTLVANLRRHQRAKLKALGIHTVAQLAESTINSRQVGIMEHTLARLQTQARLQHQKRQTQRPDYIVLDPSLPHRGLARLPKPQPGDLFFDMEGDPLYPGGGLEYLFGIGFFDEQDRFHYRAFWAHDHAQERIAFQDFLRFVQSHLERFPVAHIYHYNHYEVTALKRLAARYRIAEDIIDDFLRHQRFLDLYRVVQQSLQISESSYSLKSLEPYYGFQRVGDVRTAGESIIVYNQYREDPENRRHLLDQIESYNRVDCESTAHLRHWLVTLRPKHMPWYEPPRWGKTEEDAKTDPHPHVQSLLEQLDRAAGGDPEHPCHILADLLEFHRREAKPVWWAFFDRRHGTLDDWLDDLDCLAGLEMVGEPTPDKRSLVYTYRFPPQETRLREGMQVQSLDGPEEFSFRVGTIHELNESECWVRIKRGDKTPLPKQLSVDVGGPVSAKALAAALGRVAEDALLGFPLYPLAREILTRQPPAFFDRAPGQPVIQNSQDLEADLCRAALNLNRSFLFIQGPPGTGKTYYSARMIVHLIRHGRRVGVSANSHQAINNLLRQVEKAADGQNVKFQGIKKFTDETDKFPDGLFIRNVNVLRESDVEADLIAGTAWAFADPKLSQKIDVLFIDEAGQVPLANVIAMTTAARNIVLVGDQMQLGQPTQGVHPGHAGDSVLTYLFGEEATVCATRGVFLDESYRLRPTICRFISDTFYDGRLRAHPRSLSRSLTFDRRAADLPTEGIVFHPVSHTGCSQRSEEEGRIVRDYFDRLLGQTYQDGVICREVNIEDLLVVTPYNAQVNYLKQILPPGARVGTVDKFQGQEAAIVLVSMVASSGDDIPRGLEFLLSAQRLNVAVSRARCLAIVVANPRLLAVTCRTIDQMRLANKFCQLAEAGGYAEG